MLMTKVSYDDSNISVSYEKYAKQKDYFTFKWLKKSNKNSSGNAFLYICIWLEHFSRKILVFVLDVTQKTSKIDNVH